VVDDSKHWYQKPEFVAVIVAAIALTLTLIFW